MSFADGWPGCEKILEMILCRWILSLAYCDLFAAMHILLQRSIALVNPGSSRAHRHTCTCRSGLAIFLLDEDSQGKSIGPWSMVCYPDAGEWMKGMEHVAVRAHPDFFQQTEFKLVSEFEKGWCNCDLQLRWQVPYHTIQLGAPKESAGQSKMLQTLKWRCKKAFRTQFARGCKWYQMMQSGFTVKRYSEGPKNDNLDPKIAFFNWGFADRSCGCTS